MTYLEFCGFINLKTHFLRDMAHFMICLIIDVMFGVWLCFKFPVELQLMHYIRNLQALNRVCEKNFTSFVPSKICNFLGSRSEFCSVLLLAHPVKIFICGTAN